MTISYISNTFRLFISSTFSDFAEEREALQKRVFPELEEFCSERGARFQAIDLRWGITEEAQQEHDTLRICLEEVRRCQELSPRPNFAVLLGDRYGWEPVPARIPMDHWERLLAAANGVDGKTIQGEYQGPDLNAVPPVMHLRKREDDWAASEEREATLREALRRAADQAGFMGEERLPYFASATHQEISLGALDTHDEEGNALHPEEHVNVYIRHIEGLPNNASARAFIDWDAQRQIPVQGARQKLAELELQLRERLPGKVHDIQAHWGIDGTDKSHLDTFCAQFLADQKAIIERELSSRQALPDSETRNARHLSFAKERARNFAGRELVLEGISGYLNQSGAQSPLILHGSGGTGKSALMSQAYLRAIEGYPNSTVRLARFIGGVPGTESLMTLLIELTADIAEAYGRPAPSPPESVKAAHEAFDSSLQSATAERPLMLFMDALDQLDQGDGAWLLEWLPKVLGEHVRVVVSTREGPTLLSAQRRYQKTLLEVPAMTVAEGELMLDTWLLADTREAHYHAGVSPVRGRRLTHQQREQVLSTFAQTGKPLWLKLAYEEARSWASWDEAKALPETVEAMVEALITKRLLEGENHPRAFTTRALAYLTAGRFGLAEEELDHALATDPEVKAEFEAQNAKTGQKWQPDEKRPRLPPILWSRLYFDLQPYLSTAQVDGTFVYRWFHREFKEGIGKCHLADENSRQTTHGHLAETFFALAPYGDNLFKYTDASGMQQPAAVRRVMEQPWQLASAGRNEDLQALLTDFGFCMAKCAANAAADLAKDYSTSTASLSHGLPGKHWLRFTQRNGHLLRRGDKVWPAHKILLQLAAEESATSALAIAARRWLEAGQCDWTWLREMRRQLSSPSAVLEGHRWSISGIRVLPGDRLLTWCGGIENEDHSLRMWDGQTGFPLFEMADVAGGVTDLEVMPDGRLLCWSEDLLTIRDGTTGVTQMVLDGHTANIRGALILPDGRLLSWSSDHTLRIWNGKSGESFAVLKGHTGAILGAHVLTDGRVLSWSNDQTLRTWDSHSGAQLSVMEGHTKWIGGAKVLPDGQVVSWSDDGTLRLWNGQSGASLAVMEGHNDWVEGALSLPDGRLISWARDQTLRLWDGLSGKLLAVLEGHTSSVNGAQILPSGQILSWSYDKSLRIWDSQTGQQKFILYGHTGPVTGASVLADGRVLSWSKDHTLRLWHGVTGAPLNVMSGHTSCVTAVVPIGSNKFVSWAADNKPDVWDRVSCGKWDEEFGDSDHRALIWDLDDLPQDIFDRDHNLRSLAGSLVLNPRQVVSWSRFEGGLRIWNINNGCPEQYIDIQGDETNLVILSDERFVTWSEHEDAIDIWDRQNCEWLGCLEEHSCEQVILLSSELLLSHGTFGTMTLWCLETFEPLVRFEGCPVLCGARLLTDGRIITWHGYGQYEIWLWDSKRAGFLPFELEPSVPVTKLIGHTDWINGVFDLSDGQLISSSQDGTLRLWDGKSGAPILVMSHSDSLFTGATGDRTAVMGSHVIANGNILSWSRTTVWVWDGKNDLPLGIFETQSSIRDVQVLAEERFLVICRHKLMVVEDFLRSPLRVMKMHNVKGAKQLSEGHIAAWTDDGSLTLWEIDSGITRRYPSPWIETCDRLPSINFEGKIADAHVHGSIWMQAHGTYLSVVDTHSGWIARWHGDIVDVQDYLPPMVIGRDHTQLRFLEVFGCNDAANIRLPTNNNPRHFLARMER